MQQSNPLIELQSINIGGISSNGWHARELRQLLPKLRKKILAALVTMLGIVRLLAARVAVVCYKQTVTFQHGTQPPALAAHVVHALSPPPVLCPRSCLFNADAPLFVAPRILSVRAVKKYRCTGQNLSVKIRRILKFTLAQGFRPHANVDMMVSGVWVKTEYANQLYAVLSQHEAPVKLPKCLEEPYNTYDRSTNSSRMRLSL